jgi:hypothetical protein
MHLGLLSLANLATYYVIDENWAEMILPKSCQDDPIDSSEHGKGRWAQNTVDRAGTTLVIKVALIGGTEVQLRRTSDA